MKNKVIAATLVLGFTIAPTTAYAAITTNQGGTPSYSCPEGQTLQGDKCLIPQQTNIEVLTAEPTVTTTTVPVESRGNYNCTRGIDSWARNNYFIRELGTQCSPGFAEWIGWPLWDSENFQSVNSYTCPESYTIDGTICKKSVTTVVPAQTVNATVAGVTGGSLVASVTGLLSPVWNFIQTKLLPAIALLVILGISVRLSLQAVRKFSKVA